MLNQDLIDPKDAEILSLKNLIAKFKEYDENRKIYISTLEKENGDLRYQLEDTKAQLDELCDELSIKNMIQKYKAKIDAQKKEICRLNDILSISKNLDFIEELQEGGASMLASLKDVEKRNKELEKKLQEKGKKARETERRLKTSISELVSKLSTKEPISLEKLKMILHLPDDVDISDSKQDECPDNKA